MKKRVLAILLSSAMVVSLAACGGSSSATTAATEGTTAAAETTTAASGDETYLKKEDVGAFPESVVPEKRIEELKMFTKGDPAFSFGPFDPEKKGPNLRMHFADNYYIAYNAGLM